MTDKELMQQALDALESTGLFLYHCWCDVQMNEYSFNKLNKQMEIVDAQITALRERLAPPETRPATREEKIARPGVYEAPVARVTGYYAGRCVVTPLDNARLLPDNMALYAEPQQRKPLTEDEIEAACGHNPLDYNQGFFDGVRFAEKTHL